MLLWTRELCWLVFKVTQARQVEARGQTKDIPTSFLSSFLSISLISCIVFFVLPRFSVSYLFLSAVTMGTTKQSISPHNSLLWPWPMTLTFIMGKHHLQTMVELILPSMKICWDGWAVTVYTPLSNIHMCTRVLTRTHVLTRVHTHTRTYIQTAISFTGK